MSNPSSSHSLDVALAAARQDLPSVWDSGGYKLPWEGGSSYVTMVLGDDAAEPLVKRPRLQPLPSITTDNISTDPVLPSEALDKRFRLARARARTNRVPLIFVSDDPDRDKALQTWLLILRVNPLASPIGKMMDEILSDPSLSEREKSSKTLNLISDVASEKATSTLQDRAGFVTHYLKWAESKESVCTLPFDEHEVYDYVDTVLRIKAPTTASRFLQAIRFAEGVFEIQGGLAAANSRRVKGAALTCLLKKRHKQQANELTELMVAGLEYYMRDSDKDIYLRLIAGHCLLGLAIRGRASDLQRIHCLQLDLFTDADDSENGFVEVLASRVKNAHNVEMKTSFLPMAGPASGLLSSFFGEPWIKYWLELRKSVGLPDLPVISDVADGRSLAPIVVTPRMDSSNNFIHETPVTSDDVSRGLRQILTDLGFDTGYVSKVSSHSLKATFLAWCAKFGIHKDHRRLLGYHADPNDNSILTYSRDALAHPLRELDKVLGAVCEGSFMPSASRSGRFFEEPVPLVDRFFGTDSQQADLQDFPEEHGDHSHVDVDQPDDWSVCGEDLANDGFGLGELQESSIISPRPLEDDDSDCDVALPPDWVQVEHVQGASPKAPPPVPCSVTSQVSLQDDSCSPLENSECRALDFDSQSSDSSSSTSSNCSDIARELASSLSLRSMPKLANKQSIYRHCNGRYHLGKLHDESRLACGKLMNDKYSKISDLPDFLSPVCETCFGSEITQHFE